jgi:dolichol-phosphate mannosyltransferase
MSGVSLILPTYNERGNIEPLIRRIYSALGRVEVIVVDDDSPDGTWQVARELCSTYPGLRVHRRIGERGLRSAIHKGIEISSGTLLGWLDCDLSMPPELFVEMIRCADSSDLVVGSRYVPGGGDDRPFPRRIFSRIICTLGRCLLGTESRDLTSGLILCRRRVLERLPLTGDYGEYCIALIFRAESHGFKVREVPYRFVDRARGESKTYQGLLGFLFLGTRYIGMIGRLFREKIGNEKDPHV